MKSKIGAALLLVGVFLLGCITGGVSYSLYRNAPRQDPRAASRNAPHDIAEDMGRALDLDANQKEQLKVIIGQSRERYKSLSMQFRPQYDLIRNQTDEEIRKILREDQKAKFEAFIKDFGNRHRNRGGIPPRRSSLSKPRSPRECEASSVAATPTL